MYRLVPGSLPAPATFRRRVLIIDTYELLEPIDDWVRDESFPHCPPARSR
ncbi:hypothetical protein ACQP1G_42620 [Nocardia sp. CA-107356]